MKTNLQLVLFEQNNVRPLECDANANGMDFAAFRVVK